MARRGFFAAVGGLSVALLLALSVSSGGCNPLDSDEMCPEGQECKCCPKNWSCKAGQTSCTPDDPNSSFGGGGGGTTPPPAQATCTSSNPPSCTPGGSDCPAGQTCDQVYRDGSYGCVLWCGQGGSCPSPCQCETSYGMCM